MIKGKRGSKAALLKSPKKGRHARSHWVYLQRCIYFAYSEALRPAGSDKYFRKASCLTSQPGGAVGLGRWGVNAQALAGQHLAVLGFLHQEAHLGQEPVLEARQHGGAADHHQVLREHLAGVDGALRVGRGTQAQVKHSKSV